MNILIIGAGGRENALAWKIAQSQHSTDLYIAPGNPGTAVYGKNLPISTTDFEAIKTACLTYQIKIIVVGPEDPLVKGIYDFIKKDDALKNIIVVAPSQQAALLEGSKAFSKAFMNRHNIPTASYAKFDKTTYAEGVEYLKNHSLPIVLKADGLAAGKGVIIANTLQEALDSFEKMIIKNQFGEASLTVVVESFLSGIEVSVFVLTNGADYQIIGHAKDYKRIGEGDKGLNTGGMGCVSPVPFVTENFMQKVEQQIIQPTIEGIQKEAMIYNGFIFFGLIDVAGEPFVIEYNCRLGDPETEVILPRLETDLVSLILAMDNGTLGDANITYEAGNFCTIMAVSGGYPETYENGFEIKGLEQTLDKNVWIFQAGTKEKEGKIYTQGGRVLAVTAQAETLQKAVSKARETIDGIDFNKKYFRTDIGFEFL